MSMLQNKAYKSSKRANGSIRLHMEKFEKTRAQQHAKDQCDINIILSKFQKTGRLPLRDRVPIYDDFSTVTDYKESLEILLKATDQFDNLPSELRNRFKNDPAEFLKFVENAEHKELVELGLADHVFDDHDMDGVKDPISLPKGETAPQGSIGGEAAVESNQGA